MRSSTDHILTSHAGSLPRPDDLIAAWAANDERALAANPELPHALSDMAYAALRGCDWARTQRIAGELVSRVDVHTIEDVPGPERLELNDIGVVRLRLSEPLAVDPYVQSRETGAFILIDEASNDTVAAGTVL